MASDMPLIVTGVMKPRHLKRDCRVKVVCFRYIKPGHIKQNCRVKLADEKANIVHESKESD
ncbi:hypothetical protein FRX31_026995 [Thalictrum thalictroides]|uniref:Uncharacterized protein n=1 Tax=Thalictrum thalictroides TaxID=46969 RepID=A0A7J6VFQ6_THATH|nr:hypothetical protein FRX31_026995 [Thalictrum thalictroides]